MIPEGYKQTEIGIIPEDWECVMLPKILNEKSDSIKIGPFGSQLKKEYLLSDGEYCVYGQENIYANDFFKCYRFLTCERFQQLKSCEILPNDFLISTMGTIGKCAIAPFDIKKGIMDSHLLRLRFCSAVNKDFFKYYFSSDLIQQQIKILSVGGIMSGLSSRIVKNLKVVKINIAEQEKIAEALSDTDELILSLEKLIEKKKAIKQGSMQNLLTGKTRLPGFTNKWEEIALNELFDFAKGTGLSKEKLNPDGKNKCILYGELFTRYEEIIEDVVNHTDENIGVISKAYDVLMPCSTTTNGIDLATASVIMKDGILLGGDIAILRPKNKMDSRIFGYLMRLKAKEIVQYTQGSTIVHLNIKSFAKMKINITLDYEEQKAIADILSDMDKEIEQLEQKLAKTRLIKQGMMQQLLTGKIRLV